jgi:hypothetical protein
MRHGTMPPNREECPAVTTPAIPTGGPWLTAALLCERVIEDKEGTLTVVRIVDRVISSAIGQGTPEQMPSVPVSVTLLVAFKSGDAHGRSDLRIELEPPTGLRTPIAQMLSILNEGEDRGSNLVLNLNFTAQHEGLYWFDLILDDRLITRVPLRVVYQRQETAGPPPQTRR